MNELKKRLIVLQASETAIQVEMSNYGKTETEIAKLLKDIGLEDQILQTNIALATHRREMLTAIASSLSAVIVAGATSLCSIQCAKIQTNASARNLDKVLAFEATGECIGTKAWSSVSKAI